MGNGHENQSKIGKDNHKEEAFGSAPNIQHLGHWDVDGSGHGIGHDIDDWQKRVGLEITGDKGLQVGENRQSETVGQEEEPNAIHLC